MRIGHSTIPRIRIPSLLKGNIISLDLAGLRGQWGIVCCLPHLEFCDSVFLNQHRRIVLNQGAVLLGMLRRAQPFLDPYLPKAKALAIPLLADPSRRVYRALDCRSVLHQNGARVLFSVRMESSGITSFIF